MTTTETTATIEPMAGITRRRVDDDRRADHAGALFGVHFPLRLEPFVFDVARKLSRDYGGGYWQFSALGNNGFYLSPDSARTFHVVCENGFEGDLSADALGITACLYAYSHLSFSNIDGFADMCGRQFHWLRDYALQHAEVQGILRAID